MDKLFEHVEGNRFKLNEDVDKSINKMEESMGLDYIRKFLIPAAVNSWNRACSKSKALKSCVIVRELISKNLKKVQHAHFSKDDRTTTDVIKYESIFLLPGDFKLKEPFSFELEKHIQSGRLMASFNIPGGRPSYYFVGDFVD